MIVYRVRRDVIINYGEVLKAEIPILHNQVWFKIEDNPITLERGGIKIEVKAGDFERWFKAEERKLCKSTS